MKNASLSALEEKIIRPDFDAHLIPLLLYRGSNGRGALGRMSRMWNFAITMMECEVENYSQAVKLSHNPDYAHLCGPRRPVQHGQLPSLFGRLKENPKVTDNIKGLTDYTRFVASRCTTYKLTPVSIYTNERPRYDGRFAPWRIQGYSPEKLHELEQSKLQRLRDREQRKMETAQRAQMFYPYLVHEPKGGAEDLLVLVNNAVPRSLPSFIREDICQDLIVAILAGDIDRAALKGSVRDYAKKVLKMHPLKYGHISLDAFIPGTEVPVLDRIDSRQEHF